MTRRIQVLVNFGGMETNGLRIPPGEYAIDDEHLLGCGQMLVDRGQARVIGDEPERVTKQVDEAFRAIEASDVLIDEAVIDEPIASEEAEAVDEAVSEEAEDEQEADAEDDTSKAGRKRKAR